MLLERAMKRLERAEALDEPAEKLVKVVGPATRPRVVKNALSGTWLGHRFHPLMVPLPIGFWTGALLFDLIATRRARWAAAASCCRLRSGPIAPERHRGRRRYRSRKGHSRRACFR